MATINDTEGRLHGVDCKLHKTVSIEKDEDERSFIKRVEKIIYHLKLTYGQDVRIFRGRCTETGVMLIYKQKTI